MNKYKSMGLTNVKKYMKEAGLQSKEVAEKLGVRAETVSRWVSGTNNPGLDQAEQLADILGVTISDILFKQRGMRIAGSVNYDGIASFTNSMEDNTYLTMPGMDCPAHRFCLQVDTHQQEDKHSYLDALVETVTGWREQNNVEDYIPSSDDLLLVTNNK